MTVPDADREHHARGLDRDRHHGQQQGVRRHHDATLNTSSSALNGVLSSDTVALDVNGATGTFDTKDVGTGKTVTVTGLTLTGADAGNYVITPPTTTADITVATLTVSGFTANNKPYDGLTTVTFNTNGATLVGLAPDDNVTLDTTNRAGTFASKNVGAGQTVTVTGLALAGTDATQLRADHPDGNRGHHPGRLDRDRHHGQRQGLRRQHRREARHQQPHARGCGFGRGRDTRARHGARAHSPPRASGRPSP